MARTTESAASSSSGVRVSSRSAPAGPRSLPTLTEISVRPRRPLGHVRAHRLDRVALEIAGVSLGGIHRPEEEHVGAIADLAEGGGRTAAPLRGENAVGRRGRGRTVHRRVEKVGQRHRGALRLAGEIGREHHEHARRPRPGAPRRRRLPPRHSRSVRRRARDRAPCRCRTSSGPAGKVERWIRSARSERRSPGRRRRSRSPGRSRSCRASPERDAAPPPCRGPARGGERADAPGGVGSVREQGADGMPPGDALSRMGQVGGGADQAAREGSHYRLAASEDHGLAHYATGSRRPDGTPWQVAAAGARVQLEERSARPCAPPAPSRRTPAGSPRSARPRRPGR